MGAGVMLLGGISPDSPAGAIAAPAATAAASAPNATTVSSQNLMYPRVIRLAYSGSANGTLIADATGFPSAGPVGAIFASTNGGAGFTQVGQVADSVAQGTGLCCTTLFELPKQVGSLPAGTLLWAGSVGQGVTGDRNMTIRLWDSTNQGRTWNYLSTAATAGDSGGLWEPDLFIDAAGALAIVFSDETQAGQSQQLVEATSSDAVTWTARPAIVTGPSGGDRPGMGTVLRLPSGTFLMSYEVCGQAPSQYDCAMYTRTSADGTAWGSPTDLGAQVHLANGEYFTNAPMIAVTAQGQIEAIAQNLKDSNGSVDAASGQTLFISHDSAATWSSAAAPIALATPAAGPCDNYSTALLPSADGTSTLEIATYDSGSGCTAYAADGPLPTSTGSSGGGSQAVVGAGSHRCLDIQSYGTADGTPVQLWDCSGNWNQKWSYTGGQMLNPQSGKCLDVAGGATADGTQVRLWSCNGLGAQQWRVAANGNLVNPQSGRCLDVDGWATADGSPLEIWDCGAAQSNQIWALGPHQVIGAGSGRCLDINGLATADGTVVQLWDCTGAWNQQWTLTGGQLVNPQSGKCLDVAGGATANGTQVRLWSCNGTGAQQWQAQPNGNLVNPASGRCLDVTAWATADGSPVELWDCGASQSNQSWRLA